ncbi:uncharacterized protein J3R85_002137 [Psidium guajava]|nr:uncharacterized protein J3R85_002137 [Psidium guajava]
MRGDESPRCLHFAGCTFHSEGGLMRFQHPMNKMKAIPRVDSEGVRCGANFKVDKFRRVDSIPLRGSDSNCMEWDAR